jgi:hypothetical protein
LVNECLEQIERPGWQERWHLVEILRLKGWMLMRQGRGPEAEVQLRASINCARQQQAKSCCCHSPIIHFNLRCWHFGEVDVLRESAMRGGHICNSAKKALMTQLMRHGPANQPWC